MPLRSGAAAGGAGSSPSTPGEPPILTPVEYREKYHLHVHRLPPHPGLKDYLLFLPLAVFKFVDRLCDAFGFKASGRYVCLYGRVGRGVVASARRRERDRDAMLLMNASMLPPSTNYHLPFLSTALPQFVWLLISIYGISQGLGGSYMGMSTDYYLKEDLMMEPAAAQALKSLIHLPWNIKPVRVCVGDGHTSSRTEAASAAGQRTVC